MGQDPAIRFGNWFFYPPLVCLLLLLFVQLAVGELRVFLWLNRAGSFAGSMFWISLTTFGDGLVVWVLVLPLVRRKPKLIWAMLFSWLLVTFWVQGLKFLINTPRPLAVLTLSDFDLIGAPYKSKSFPSGHAATAAMVAATFGIFFKQKWLYAVVMVLAVMVSISRIVMGIHWPTDVLVGFLGGWITAGLGYQLAAKLGLGANLIAQVVFRRHTVWRGSQDADRQPILITIKPSGYNKQLPLVCMIVTLCDIYLALLKVNRRATAID